MEPSTPPIYPEDGPASLPDNAEIRDAAFELAGTFVLELLAELNGSVQGTILLRTLGLDAEKSKVRQLAEEFSISRQSIFKYERQCSELLRRFQTVPLPARGREQVHGDRDWMTRGECAALFGVSQPFAAKFLMSKGVRAKKEGGAFLYPRKQVEAIYVNDPPQGRLEVGKKDNSRERAKVSRRAVGRRWPRRKLEAEFREAV